MHEATGARGGVASVFQIGLDIGTSATKVVVRDIVDRRRKPIALRVGPHVSGYPSVGTPSTIAVDDGRLSFGGAAEESPAAVKFRSFKMCLACQRGLVGCRGCPGRSERSRGGRGGEFQVQAGTRRVLVEAQDLFVLYLSWFRGMVVRALRESLGGLPAARFLWNVSVPVAQVDDKNSLEGFRRMFEAAASLDATIVDGVELEDALGLVRGALAQHELPPPEDTSDSRPIPETLANVLGFIQRPTTDLGMFGIIDVGAGTTDVAFFMLRPEVTNHPEEQTVTGYQTGWNKGISFFGAGAHPVGGDDVDLRVVRGLAAPWAGQPGDWMGLSGLVRRARAEGLDEITCGEQRYMLEQGAVRRAEESVARDVWSASHDILQSAWEKRKRTSLWEELPLLLVGGGCRASAVESAFQRPLLTCVARQPVVRLTASEELRGGGGVADRDIENERDFLLVAEGLSYPALNFPRYRLPSEVKGLPSPAEAAGRVRPCPCGGQNEFCDQCCGTGTIVVGPRAQRPTGSGALSVSAGTSKSSRGKTSTTYKLCPLCKEWVAEKTFAEHAATMHGQRAGESTRPRRRQRTRRAPTDRSVTRVWRGDGQEQDHVPAPEARRRGGHLKTERGNCPMCGKPVTGDELLDHLRREHGGGHRPPGSTA